MAGKKIIVFISSTRDGRFGERVAQAVRPILEKAGLSIQIFDPLKMEFEMLRQPLHFMKDRNQAPSWLLKANEEIVHADGFLVVSSEYNCSIPPALSNMMDHFPPSSYRHRPCSIVTYSMGDFAGVRVAPQLLPFLNELGLVVLPSRAALANVHKKCDDQGRVTDERFEKNVMKLVDELSWYAEAMANKKNSSGPPN